MMPVLLDVVQLHATTILEREQGFAVSMAAIPPRDMPANPPQSVDDFADALDMRIVERVPWPAASLLPQAIAAILLEAGIENADEGTGERAAERLAEFLSNPADQDLDVDPALLAFASFCAFTPTLPLEQSPIEKEVLAAIVATSGSVAIASAGTGVALIAVTGGTVVVLAVATVFAQHVAGRLDRWLRRGEPLES